VNGTPPLLLETAAEDDVTDDDAADDEDATVEDDDDADDDPLELAAVLTDELAPADEALALTALDALLELLERAAAVEIVPSSTRPRGRQVRLLASHRSCVVSQSASELQGEGGSVQASSSQPTATVLSHGQLRRWGDIALTLQSPC
jgi:hypothetical protein